MTMTQSCPTVSQVTLLWRSGGWAEHISQLARGRCVQFHGDHPEWVVINAPCTRADVVEWLSGVEDFDHDIGGPDHPSLPWRPNF
jgi:hypothetical protein